MGSGASAAKEGDSAELGAKVVKESVVQVDNGVVAAKEVDVDMQLDKIKSSLGGSVVDGAHDGVETILESVRGVMTSEQLTQAVDDFESALPNLQGRAIFVGLAGSLQAAAEMSAPVMANVGGAILVLGEHLPYIAVAAGAIGAIIYTFKMSKDYDENVKNVSFWMASVKDWLMLVAEKVTISSGVSTIPLFEALQDAMLALNTQMDSWRSKWRITKMLSSTTFERDFNRVKTSVLELKNALRDFLDEETQQRQESKLAAISSLQVETNEKLESMDDQLAQIREMLAAQEEARVKQEAEANAKKESDSKTEVKEESERIYQNIQRAAGVDVGSPVSFQNFVLIFETFFYGGADMPSEQRRGLNIAVDRDRTKVVTKAAWIKFYHQWTTANIEIEAYLNKIAAENPTLLKASTTKAIAITKHGIATADTAKKMVVGGVGDAKKKIAEGMTKIGFGKKSSEGQRAEKVAKQ